MNNGVKWNLKPIGKGKVRIVVDSFSKIPTMEDYKKYIETLLKDGKSNNDRKLLDESNSAFIGENILLSQELSKMNFEEIVFSTSEGDVVVNKENLEEVFDSLKYKRVENNNDEKSGVKNLEAIGHAVRELFELG